MKLTEAKSFIKHNYLGNLTYLDKYEITNTLRFGLTKNQQFLIMIWLKDLAKKYWDKNKYYSYYNNFDDFFDNTNWGQLYIEIKNIKGELK